MSSQQSSESKSFSVFKQAQVKFKYQGKRPSRDDDLGEVVDFSRGGDNRIIRLEVPDGFQDCVGIYRGPIYGLKGFPGFLFAPEALSESLQLELAFQSVDEYCESPNKTNIDLCSPKPTEEFNPDECMWEAWKKANMTQETPKKRKTDNHNRKKYRSFKKMSWATAGYHYDWNERCYNKESKSPMPSLVEQVSQVFAKTSLALDGKSVFEFSPEAAIVNYYNMKSLMGGHRDELELALDKPVVSLSTGLPAIYLLGGKTKDDEPVVPVLVRKGDVMCLGGDTRLNYHAMARILPSSVAIPNVDVRLNPTEEQKVSLEKLSLSAYALSSEDKLALEEYLSHHRININARQVYPKDSDGETSPD